MKPSYLAAVICLAAGIAACGTQAGSQKAAPPATAAATVFPAGTVTASPARSVAASSRPASPPASPPTLTGPATLSAADNGAIVRLHVGQRVTVTLASPGWHVPSAAGTAVRRVSAGGGYPGRQPARAVFLAVRSGSATLTAIGDMACLHAQPACELPQPEWLVAVIVTGS